MRKDINKWLVNPAANPHLTVATAMVWIGVLITVYWLVPIRKLESDVISPVLFKARELLHEAPALNSNIKVFALDDTTVNQIKRSELTLTQWATLFESLDSKHPKAIIIDGLFSIADPSKEPGGAQAVHRIQAIQTPLITGAYTSPVSIFGRDSLPLAGPQYLLDNYLDSSMPGRENKAEALRHIQIADFQSAVVYGANISLWKQLYRPGHVLYGDDQGNYMPMLRLKDGKTLPHIMLMPFGDSIFMNDGLKVNGSLIRTARDGRAPINFGPRRSYDEAIAPLIQILDERWRSQALAKIGMDDYIYLVPMFFTGNTDFKPSPIGLIPGAYSHLAVLNSILQKSGLYFVEIDPVLIIAFAALLSGFGWWMTPASLILTLLFTTTLWALTCVCAFVYEGALLPFLLPEMSLLGIGVSLLLQRIHITDRKSRIIRHALEGVVNPASLKVLQKNPEKLSLEAKERVITVMFIDIVGFSLVIESQLPRIAFAELQSVIEDMSQIVLKHGGVVNKTLGDGLLCFFGYSLADNKETGHHAEEAFAAALEIQQKNLPRILSSLESSSPIFPLRIGVNTAAVFMGNLGSGERLDITVIGNGVNLAKRLENACKAHAILIGPTTHELIRGKSSGAVFTRREIEIKHRKQFVEAWEYDPMHGRPEIRSQTNDIYAASTHRNRHDQGGAVVDDHLIAIMEQGTGRLTQFSAQGFTFRLSTLIARGTVIALQLDTPDGSLHRQLIKQGLQKIRVEVRWVHTDGADYLHGVRLLYLDSHQSESLMDLLCQFGPKQELSKFTAS
ncbi:MAG: adenylate/guanylate cyclase domain-containing protein [Chitinophagaceae bacterium]|nr:adenylate/guanylate cyclase domain-containing protein [Oligoflexus sp.]